MQPAAGTGVRDTGHRPQRGANHKAQLEPDDVDKPAAQRLEDGISQLKCADDPRILLGGNTESGFQFRGNNPQRVACDVVDGDAKQEQYKHPPAQVFYHPARFADCHIIVEALTHRTLHKTL